MGLREMLDIDKLRYQVNNGVIISDTTYNSTWKTGIPVVDPATDIITLVGHGFANGDAIEFDAGSGVLPAGISAYNADNNGGFYYNVINATTDTFQVTSTVGGTTPVDITAAGTAGWRVRSATLGELSQLTLALDLNTIKKYTLLYFLNTANKTAGVWIAQIFSGLVNNTLWLSADPGNPVNLSTKRYTKCLIRADFDLIEPGIIMTSIKANGKMTDDKSSWSEINKNVSGIITYTSGNLTGYLLRPNNYSYGDLRNGTRIVALRRTIQC
jgi:hypothetical protein